MLITQETWIRFHCSRCALCNCGGDLLLCSAKTCTKAFHLTCTQPILQGVPLGDWYCPACKPEFQTLELQIVREERDHSYTPGSQPWRPIPRKRRKRSHKSRQSRQNNEEQYRTFKDLPALTQKTNSTMSQKQTVVIAQQRPSHKKPKTQIHRSQRVFSHLPDLV